MASDKDRYATQITALQEQIQNLKMQLMSAGGGQADAIKQEIAALERQLNLVRSLAGQFG